MLCWRPAFGWLATICGSAGYHEEKRKGCHPNAQVLHWIESNKMNLK
jgi:hypothetical protein